MGKIQIMTDSASDISYADEKKYNISVIPFPITLGDKTYTSRVDFDNQQFFDLMAQYDEIPKTAQIPPFQFQEVYLQHQIHFYPLPLLLQCKQLLSFLLLLNQKSLNKISSIIHLHLVFLIHLLHLSSVNPNKTAKMICNHLQA